MTVLKGAVAALILGAGSAQAATYDALPTVSDHTGGTINLWFDVLMADRSYQNYRLIESGQMSFEDDGTSSLGARAYASEDDSTGFDIEMGFDDDVPVGSAYKDVFGRFGGVEPDNIVLSVITGGTLYGFGGFESLELDVIQYPSPEGAVTQVGGGTPGGGTANQHNENYGMSTWFAISGVRYDAACSLCSGLLETSLLIGAQGDVVLDLEPSAVPLPAGVAFLLTGLGALGLMRRRG